MSYSRVVVGMFSLAIMYPICAMDEQQQPKKTIPIVPRQSIATGSLSLSSSAGNSPQSPGSSMSSYLSSAFNEICNLTATGLKSATATVSNAVSNDSAFQKLGWPSSDAYAQSELAKCIAKYKAHQEFLLNPDYYLLSDYTCHKAFIERRRGYLARAILAFHTLPDGIQFATHCLEHHHCIMNSFDKDEISVFLKQKQQAALCAGETMKQVLERDQ